MKKDAVVFLIIGALSYIAFNAHVKVVELKSEVSGMQDSIQRLNEYTEKRNQRAVENQESIIKIKETHKSDLESMIDLNDFIKELSKESG